MRLSIRKVRLNRQGYAGRDFGHRYFGVNDGRGDVYVCESACEYDARQFIRAMTRADAVRHFKALFAMED